MIKAIGNEDSARAVANHLRRYRLRFGTEQLLQQDVMAALHGYRSGQDAAIPEFRLGEAGIIDFYMPDLRVGIECKVAGSIGDVVSQLQRYAGASRIDGLVLVTRCRQHTKLPPFLRRKPLWLVWVAASL